MLEQQEMDILFVHRMLNNKTQSPFPSHRVGFRLVIPQVFNLQKWMNIVSLFLFPHQISKLRVCHNCIGMRRLSKYDKLIYLPPCSGDCDWIHPWDTRCDHGNYFLGCRNKCPRLHGQLNSSKTRYCVC